MRTVSFELWFFLWDKFRRFDAYSVDKRPLLFDVILFQLHWEVFIVSYSIDKLASDLSYTLTGSNMNFLLVRGDKI